MTEPRANRSRRVTLRDVAAVVGVDPSAVSRVVNNDPQLSISATTREKILAAVSELGYRPNFGARGLRTSKTFTIGLILPSLVNPMYEGIVRGVAVTAEKRGYGVVLGSQIESTSAMTFAGLLQEGRVDGLLIASGTLRDDFIREIAEHGPGPVISVNRRIEGVGNSVIVDDEGASRKAFEYLHGLGHQVVAGIFGPSEVETSVRRRKGFVSGAESFKLSPIVVDCSGVSVQDGYTGTREILRKHPTVTAIFTSTLLMGMGALRAAGEEQRPVPASLSVICLHDSFLADFFFPSLSSIRMPIEELGIAAVELLIDLCAGGPNREIMIAGDGEIIERESTGPAPLFSEIASVLKGS